MMRRRLFSVGFGALVLTGALLAQSLLPQANISQVYAQEQAQTAGNAAIGPNDAQVNPAITDKVTGIPVVVLMQASRSEYWVDSIQRYGSAQPLVIRITEVELATANQDWASVGRNLAAVLQQTGRTDSIVVFGNELNNLDREWKSRSAPSSPSEVSQAETEEAARIYAQMYTAFASGMPGIRVAPAPPDMANPMYPWDAWISPIVGIYSGAGARVMNAYEKPEDPITAQLAAFEARVGATVDFFTEIGIDPNNSDLSAHVNFLNTYQPPRPAATLVPNHCRSGGWGNGANVDDWLFYVRGVLYTKEGATVEPSSCGENENPTPTGSPVFLYPDPNLPATTFRDELDMYLANSQAYCAPSQVFWPTRPVTAEPLISCSPGSRATWITGERSVCLPEDYPVVDVEESVSLTSVSFPLFRSDAGGISIESDLSRVKPGETLAQALERNSRPEAAPQFFLSTPQTQCNSAANFVQYVRQLCEQDGLISPEQQKDCGANVAVRMPDGTTKQVLEFQGGEYLPNAAACENYTVNEVAQNTVRAQAVQAITPFTPKVYKMGFYVQHTKLSGSKDGTADFWQGAQRNVSQLVMWFAGQEPDYPEPQERIDVVPVWYHAGITASQYDSNQLRPYAFDLREYSISGAIEPKDFDPAAVAEQTRRAEASGNRNIVSAASEVAIPQTDPTNFGGPLWQTYAFVMPQHVQDQVATRRLQVVFQNYFLMQFMRDQYFGQGSLLSRDQLIQGVGSDVITSLRLNREWFWRQPTDVFRLPFECRLLGGGVDDPGYRTCATFRDITYDSTAPNPLQPLGQSYEEIAGSFPQPIVLPQNESNLDLLKQSLIARINAGVQTSTVFNPEADPNADPEPAGPLSVRQLGIDMCNVDQTNTRQGEQDRADGILSNAVQPLDKEDETGTPAESTPIVGLLNTMRAWVYGGPRSSDDGTRNITDRVTRAYIILPDEALSIETLQSYTAPMFLSPEMYASIIRGENPIYPFAQRWQDLLAGLEPSEQGASIRYSAFLRAGGERTVTAEEEGFKKGTVVSYQPIYTGCDNPDGPCACGGVIARSPEYWISIDDFVQEAPNTSNNCQGYEETDRRTVGVTGNQPGKEPDAGLNVPGNLAALGEFVRRLAFTPEHMQNKAEYTGLEDFYANGILGGTGGSSTTNPELSEYFQSLISGLPSLYTARTGKQCNALYVSQSDAQNMAAPMLTLLRNKEFASYMANTAFGSGKRMIFDTCGGNASCMEFITQTLTSTPVCDGQTYLNPLMAYGIAMNEETNGLKEGNGWHFGCNLSAFTQYQANGTASYNGLACTVKTAAGHTVLNPLITATEGQVTSQAAVNQCVNPAASRDTAANRSNTPEDGFACFISVSHYLCRGNNSDADALRAYGYIAAEGASPVTPVNRIDDFATLAQRQVGQTLPNTPEVLEAISQLRVRSELLKSRLGGC